MARFEFGKKKEKEKSCCCSCSCIAQTPAKDTNACCSETAEGICCMKVLGAGCKSCREQYENAKKAVANMDLPVEVEYITEMEQAMQYGVMRMPAIVINEKVVAMGKVLKIAEVEALLRKYL